VGVHDPRPKDGKSRVDFHSFRRWFISRASGALNEGATGFSPWTIAEVVAHSQDDMPLDMTMRHYKDPDATEAQRACIEAVQLPPEARTALLERYPVPELEPA
jgi:integrase